MKKLNEELKSKITFTRGVDMVSDEERIIICARYNGLFRSYAYTSNNSFNNKDAKELEEEIKNTLTKSISDALKNKF